MQHINIIYMIFKCFRETVIAHCILISLEWVHWSQVKHELTKHDCVSTEFQQSFKPGFRVQKNMSLYLTIMDSLLQSIAMPYIWYITFKFKSIKFFQQRNSWGF